MDSIVEVASGLSEKQRTKRAHLYHDRGIFRHPHTVVLHLYV
jgi:hypothetical protein